MTEWINVKDGLPQKAGNVLVAVDMWLIAELEIDDKHSNPEIMYYSLKHKKFNTNSVVTHWMTLPAPPKLERMEE